MENEIKALRIEFTTDDDGVVVYIRRGFALNNLIATGVAMHAGKGPNETFRRAIAMARKELISTIRI